jgi:hypothetical protein
MEVCYSSYFDEWGQVYKENQDFLWYGVYLDYEDVAGFVLAP